MTNVLESVKSLLSNEPKDIVQKPLHIGEVMHLWTYLGLLEEANRFVEIGLNTTTDEELIKALKNSFSDCANQINVVIEMLTKEGVPLPPASEKKPQTNPSDVPQGVKLTDSELANGLALKSISAVNFCALGLSESLRPDIGRIWLQFLLKRAEFMAYFRPIMNKRGWLKVPPYYKA